MVATTNTGFCMWRNLVHISLNTFDKLLNCLQLSATIYAVTVPQKVKNAIRNKKTHKTLTDFSKMDVLLRFYSYSW